MKLKKSNIVLICLAVVYFTNIAIHNIVILRKQTKVTVNEYIQSEKYNEEVV